MFQPRVDQEHLSQGTLLTCLLDEWHHFEKWCHYIVLNHSCDLWHKESEIKYLFLVEAYSIASDILWYIEEFFTPSLKEEFKWLSFHRSDYPTEKIVDVTKLYKKLEKIYNKLTESKRILEIDKKLETKLKEKEYDLRQFLYFNYSDESKKEFYELYWEIWEDLERYLRFLKKHHISEDTDFSSAKPTTFFLFMSQDETSIPDFLEVNFLKTIPLEMTKIKWMIENWTFGCKLELKHPYLESFSRKLWDFFSRVALP